MKKAVIIFLLLAMAATSKAVDPNLVAHYTMDKLDGNSFSKCTTLVVNQPDVFGTGNKIADFNGYGCWQFDVNGWQLIRGAAGIMTDSNNWSAGSTIVWYGDRFYWPLQDQGNNGIYIKSSPTLPGDTWTKEGYVKAGGSRAALRSWPEIGDTNYYLYYYTMGVPTADEGSIYVRKATDKTNPGGTYGDATLVFSPAGGGLSVWDANVVAESFPYYNQQTSRIEFLYMGCNGKIGNSTAYEKVGRAWAASPMGTWTRYANQPILYGQGYGTWDGDITTTSNVKAADPTNHWDGEKWIVSIAACTSTYGTGGYHTGYWWSPDMNTFYEMSATSSQTLNPLIDTGAVGSWTENGLWRATAPVTYNGQMYVGFQAEDDSATPIYNVGFATLTIDPNWYLWRSDANWIVSTAVGIRGDRHWSLNNNSHGCGTYTARGTATGSLAVANTRVPSETGLYDAVLTVSSPVVAATGKINGGVITTYNNFTVNGAPVLKSVAMWIKPTALTSGTKGIFRITSSPSTGMNIVYNGSQGTLTPTGFSDANVVYVDGAVSSIIPTADWHHIAITDTTSKTASSMVIGRLPSSNRFAGTMDDVRFYNKTLTQREVKRLAKKGGKGLRGRYEGTYRELNN